MSGTTDRYPILSHSTRQVVESMTERFEQAWKLQGAPDRLAPFVAGAGEAEAVVIVEVAITDMEYRADSGLDYSAQQALDEFPDLAPAAAAEIVRAEFHLRTARGEAPSRSDYLHRFQQVSSILASQLVENDAPDIESRRTDRVFASRFGKFQLLELLGAGSFARVYRARDTELDREVAVKLPRDGMLGDHEEQERFLREAQSIARCQHVGVVPIYETGRVHDTPYLVFEYVKGPTLAHALQQHSFLPREAVRLLIEISDAVGHAHQHGIIHRDLKPSNILLETRVDDPVRPRVTDFGLARLTDSEMTLEGQVLGTPAYMSPEQARGEIHRTDARSDVYSLGVIFYRLLTGENPFHGNARMIVQQVMHDTPSLPRRLNDAIPRDLEVICLKAMSKERGRRYASAREFGADLKRWADGKPIHAKPVSWIERGGLWARRNIAALSVVAIVLGLFSAGGALVWREVQHARARQLYDFVLTASLDLIPRAIQEQLPRYRALVNPRFESLLTHEPPDSERRLRALLALAPTQTAYRNDLVEFLLRCPLGHFTVVRDAAAPLSAEARDRLWRVLDDRRRPDSIRFRAGMALAFYQPDSIRWTREHDELLVNELLATSPDYQRDFRESLRPRAAALLELLETRFGDPHVETRIRDAAGISLADLASDDADRLSRLVCMATPTQFRYLFSALLESAADRGAIVDQLRAVAARQPPESMPREKRLSLGRQRANAAVGLLKLGHAAAAMPVLDCLEDPEALFQFVHAVHPRNTPIAALVSQLERENDPRRRYALLLAIATYDVPDGAMGENVMRCVEQWYEEDPSAAVHAAARWLLRRWGSTEVVDRVDQTVTPSGRREHRDWFVERLGSQYVTFVVIRPGHAVIGSPADEPDRDVDETQVAIEITRTFAIAMTEITVGQWAEFVHATGDSTQRQLAEQWPNGSDFPMAGFGWLKAVDYCRWVTSHAGMSEADQCYEDPSRFEQGPDNFPVDYPFHPERRGFRLPTEAEWEYACRCGTTTMINIGNDAGLVKEYAWFRENAGGRPHAVATRRPNLNGVFDMYGNLFEWCHDGYVGERNYVMRSDPVKLGHGRARVHRGGSWNYGSWYCRSAQRGSAESLRYSGVGMRLVRTER